MLPCTKSTSFLRNALLRCWKFQAVLFVLSLPIILAEKKVSVSEVILDSSVEDVQWIGPNHSTVLCRTARKRLYRSYDSGRTWHDMSSLISPPKKDVIVTDITVSPVDTNIVLITGEHHTHYISSDGARTFRPIERYGTLHNFLFHPSKSHLALVSVWTEGCNLRSDGVTFTLITDFIVQFSWGDIAHGKADQMYFTRFQSVTGGSQSRHGGWSENVSFCRMSSPRSRIEVLVPRGNKFLVSNGYIFVAQLLDPDRQTVALVISSDGGETFNAAKLPVQLQEHSYTILDASQGAVMIHVNHGHLENGMTLGNVYISDHAGLRYSLSLPRNIRSSGGECEFDRVASIEGVFLANFMGGPAVEEIGNDDINEEVGLTGWLLRWQQSMVVQMDGEDNTSQTAVDRRKRSVKSGKVESHVKTVISFDKGAVWSYLTPPSIDSQGKPIVCDFRAPANVSVISDQTATKEGDCWLNLHGITTFQKFAPFYSVDSAVGIVMGTGNVGASLRYEPEEVNTYLSRDGGLNWVEAHKGAYIYEFGDHGGLVVMANDSKKTRQVVFSWNEGETWYDFDLGEQSMDVDNIVIEPNSSSVEFLVYGTRGISGVIYHLDFSTLDQPACKGVFAAGSVSSDYEKWTATDGRVGSSCLLGRQTTFTRRKRSSECFNGKDFSRPVGKVICQCSELDYECEYGFTREIGSLTCLPEEDKSLTQEGCTSSGMFYTDAYRKIPGDVCEGGWSPSKVPILCPSASPLSSRAKRVLFLIVGVIGLLGILTFLNTDPRFQHLMRNMGVDSLTSAKYAVLGSASRFVEAFEGNETADVVVSPSAGYSNTTLRDDDDMQFIESAEKAEMDDDNAPPLLDFTTPPPHHTGNLFSEFQGIEEVPRLHPPPSSSTVIREFEML